MINKFAFVRSFVRLFIHKINYRTMLTLNDIPNYIKYGTDDTERPCAEIPIVACEGTTRSLPSCIEKPLPIEKGGDDL